MSAAMQLSSSTSSAKSIQGCRFCGEQLTETCVDLGVSPLCESWLNASDLNKMEPFYPLHVFVCHKCFLVQVNEYVSGTEIFGGEYAYFSSYSDSWLAHARRYVEMITSRLQLNATSKVIELASNDGYLLQYFKERGIPCLGIEPAENCAEVAKSKGIPSICRFFGVQTAKDLVAQGERADLLLGNNVLAHVPDLNDFVGGIKILLAEKGTNTMEFPHLVPTMEGNQFDSMYQEHYCYFSFHTIERVFAAHGLTLFDVEELPTHGGSLRIYARHSEDTSRPVTERVTRMREREFEMGYADLKVYHDFAEKVVQTKHKLLELLIRLRREGNRIAAYGAPGKAATLLNYCGVREDLIEFTVDRNPYKHGRFMPGVRIPVFPTERIAEVKPDYVVILPWNLKDEILEQLAYIREWGGKFVLPIPEATIIE
jgi:hypothetical protein